MLSNELMLLIYAPFMLISLILLADTLRQSKRDYAVRQYLLFCLCLCGWFVCEILYYVLKDPAALRYVFELKLAFVAFLAVSLFFSVAGFYRIQRLLPSWLPGALCVVPAITAVLALLDPFHSLLLKSFEIVQLSPVTRAVNVLGPWYYVHLVYSQGLALVLVLMLVRQYGSLPRAFRSGTSLMCVGAVCYMVSTVLCSFGLNRNTIDYNLIGVSCCAFCYHFACRVNGRTNFLQLEDSDVFHYLDEAVLILNSEGTIIDKNHTADRLFGPVAYGWLGTEFTAALNDMRARGLVAHRPAADGEAGDLFIQSGRFQLVYAMEQQPFASAATGRNGAFVIFTDVTDNRLMMERLRDTAGYDALTGLPNRYRYRQLLREVDTEETLPLSIVIGDVNRLKHINDTLGHSAGDRLLKEVAGILAGCCPSDGHACRLGGDEFVLLLPGCNGEMARQVMDAASSELAALAQDGQGPVVALGCTTKTRTGQNINQMIHEADMNMYQNKERVNAS